MKCPQYRARNDNEDECSEWGNKPSTTLETSKKGDGNAIKGLKLGCLVGVFGLVMGGVLILLIFAMWAILAIIFGVIFGISFTSPLCWAVGGIFSAIIISVELVHKTN
ncbi:hypothetical protein [Methanobacterium sp.]|uniref:hypothetical protein n=1 Tax=Methanobacterium sp. TaxID=2164 RepID=UPI002ABA38DB|nr:hypothetical protein [Methanobacterium sp.]MDY9924498.1 hypothetical protein [Methanobacterium sp.]